MRVYLAGPISGFDYAGATGWREFAIEELWKRGIAPYSPMRGKDVLVGSQDLTFAHITTEHPMTTSRGIMARDHNDCVKADALLVNLSGTTTPSVGTAMEMAWAFHLHIPVVVVCEPENVHLKHPMIRETVDFRVDDLDQGIELVTSILQAI